LYFGGGKTTMAVKWRSVAEDFTMSAKCLSGTLRPVRWTAVVVSLLITAVGEGQQAAKPAPTHRNVAYGDHERHVLDFWKAASGQPTPLVVYIHGGGFRAGSKESINARTLRELLEVGISVAALHYRFVSQAPLPAAHEDCRRALQFLRSKAGQWNIDNSRVGAFGGSAGAQLSMWLAFHDEMADPNSSDPVARESTRLACVGTNGGQTTMDVDWWLANIPGYAAPHRDFRETFGAETKREYLGKAAGVSALSLISKDDPPIYMTYAMKPDDPVPDNPQRAQGWKVHHVVFGMALKEKMDALGIEADLEYPGARTKYASMSQFFIAKLAKEGVDARSSRQIRPIAPITSPPSSGLAAAR
jgi:acetyl esterase/lipase